MRHQQGFQVLSVKLERGWFLGSDDPQPDGNEFCDLAWNLHQSSRVPFASSFTFLIVLTTALPSGIPLGSGQFNFAPFEMLRGSCSNGKGHQRGFATFSIVHQCDCQPPGKPPRSDRRRCSLFLQSNLPRADGECPLGPHGSGGAGTRLSMGHKGSPVCSA